MEKKEMNALARGKYIAERTTEGHLSGHGIPIGTSYTKESNRGGLKGR